MTLYALYPMKLFPREKLVKTFYVGDVTQDNQGTFMLMKGAENPYVINIPGFRGFVASRFSALDYEWRDYTVFHSEIGEIKSIEVDFPSKEDQSYRVNVNNSRDIQLISLENDKPVLSYDTLRMLNFLTAFQDLRFEALLNEQIDQHVIDSVLSTKPRTIISLTDRDNKVNEVKIYYKKSFGSLYDKNGAALEPFDLDRGYATVNGGKDFVLIQYYVFDKVTRTLSYLEGKE